MAITAVNITWIGGGPTGTLQQFAPNASTCQPLIGTATFTGDASTLDAVANYIDGTKQLGFTPSAVLAFTIGGNDTAATSSIKKCVDDAFSGGSKACTVTYAVAPSSSGTSKVLFLVWR